MTDSRVPEAVTQLKVAEMTPEQRLAAADYAEEWEDTKNRLQYAMDLAQTSLKSLFLVNGASLISLLTFIGNGGDLAEPDTVFWAFVWFSCGLACVLTASIGAYISQSFYMQASMVEAWKSKAKVHGATANETDSDTAFKRGERLEYAALGLSVLSLSFFIAGAFVALDALT